MGAEADAPPSAARNNHQKIIASSVEKKDVTPWIANPTESLIGGREQKKEWNTSKLGLRLGADAASALAAGALVAPIITMIDK